MNSSSTAGELNGDRYWVVRKGKAPLGDYGTLLVHGMSGHRARVEGRLQLERTGPTIPPMSLPGVGGIVVTSALREDLERRCVSGATFQPLDKAHIARVQWDGLEKSLKKLVSALPNGEPEGLILSRPHDPGAANALGELWELVPTVGGNAASQRLGERPPARYQWALEPGSVPDVDIFRASNMKFVFVSERLRAFLEPVVGDAVAFHEVILGELPPAPPRKTYLLHDPAEPIPAGYEVTETSVSPFTGKLVRVVTLVQKP